MASSPPKGQNFINNNPKAPNVLNRYGGQAGPTGATFAPTSGASPVSLANFIGGRTAGPRLGKLQGDGRSAPPEAETFFRDYPAAGTSPNRRGIALPGLASPPGPALNNGSKPLADFLAARAQSSGNNSSSTSLPSTAVPGRVSPIKDSVLPSSASARTFGSSAASATSATSDPVTPASVPSSYQGSSRFRGSQPVSVSSSNLGLARGPSQTKSASASEIVSPSQTTSSKLGSPAIASNNFVPSASPPKRSWTASDTFRQQPSSQPQQTQMSAPDKFPTASLTRLGAKGMVGQRVQEAQNRNQQLASSNTDTPASRANTSQSTSGIAALRDRWAQESAAPASAAAAAASVVSPPSLARNPLPRPPSPEKSAYMVPQASVPASTSATAAPKQDVVPVQQQGQQTSVKKEVEPAHGRRSTTGKRILVLISGSGTNLQALIDATIPALQSADQPHIPDAQIVGVISNRKAAFGLQRARTADPPIPAQVFSLKSFKDDHQGQGREEYDEALARVVLGFAPDLIVLAGFMHIVSPRFLNVLSEHATLIARRAGGGAASKVGPVPIINLHPALPGQFDGANAIDRAWAAYEAGEIEQTGVMIHEVIAEVDRGAPILVETIDMLDLNSLEELEAKTHAVEHRLIVQGARKVLESVW
ncbi:Bifunctional purine biosynthetic protein ADE5,7 [Tilletia horrida]|uniref:phosphoribosylglycinamide formyltransferase 1 n=1 Tax=Tilletia horrida TaxID=155126 RepID=A0AAN6GVL6_9BASI|nr:Bifunctional purine biosynthetic protein ADE5,7 [Tilletia horrida]KAK0552001.1 Bifunctional purine biosynthetic protein ADE5,7 [Tilletia horrida]KAK0566154.1 Bifunctional purine biosynthetic protein ADE5,7 [Tilletia horrida]